MIKKSVLIKRYNIASFQNEKNMELVLEDGKIEFIR